MRKPLLLPHCRASCAIIAVADQNRMAPTSYPMALAALVPLPFDIVFTALRFWIRSKRNAWGPDDWAMLVNLVSLPSMTELYLTLMNV